MSIGDNIREIAKNKNKSLKEISDYLGMKYTTFHSFLQKDNDRVDIGMLAKIAKKLDVPVSDLIETSYEFRDAPQVEATNSEAIKQYYEQKRKLEDFDSQVERLNTGGKVKVYDYIDDLDPKYKEK